MNRKFRPDQARFASNKPKGARVILADNHRASVEATTLFPTRVFHASTLPRLLKSGHNSPKTGKMVEKGLWAGCPIYTLTLEERATCSRECLTWDRCYGKNMRYAERIINDEAFEKRLWQELHSYNYQHPEGFVVRLHVLGDFYDCQYVRLWMDALEAFPGLKIWGYTGRGTQSDIGIELMRMNKTYPERCRIRFSGTAMGGFGSLVIKSEAESNHVICPAQTDKTACCATCAFCWTSNQTVEFLEH